MKLDDIAIAVHADTLARLREAQLQFLDSHPMPALETLPLGIMSAAALSLIPWVRDAAAAQEQLLRDAAIADLERRNAEWYAAHPSFNWRFPRQTIMARKIRRMLKQ
jgi:hypothetical protein